MSTGCIMALIKNHIHFDLNGNLQPHTLQKMTDSQARNVLIDSFNPSEWRIELWDKFNQYRSDMASLLSFDAEQWIDGSYVTTKDIPADIDVVTYINVHDLMLHQNELKRFLTTNGSKEVYGIDGYIVPVFHHTDSYYDTITKDRMDYWREWFGKDRDNNPKGIAVLELSCS